VLVFNIVTLHLSSYYFLHFGHDIKIALSELMPTSFSSYKLLKLFPLIINFAK